MYSAFTIIAAVALILPPTLTQQLLPITVLQGEPDTCPSDQEREEARQNITTTIQRILRGFQTVPQCGNGVWKRVAFLNMSDSSQQCPSPWREYTSIRSCGRQQSTGGSCDSMTFSIFNSSYNKICGKAIGHQYNTADAFAHIARNSQTNTADDNYVDGLSVTYGNPRNHIWTFAVGGVGEIEHLHACPCVNSNLTSGTPPPSYVGNSYFCDTGRRSGSNGPHFSEPLWDGVGCVTSQCCSFNTPPWFSIQLPTSTTDDIEVRICSDQDTNNEDTTVQLLEIYVQ